MDVHRLFLLDICHDQSQCGIKDHEHSCVRRFKFMGLFRRWNWFANTTPVAARMAKAWLGNVHLVEACLPGRTTAIDDPEMGAFVNGHTHLLPTLLSHQPIDLVIIMLGTNDFKARFNRSVEEIAQSILDLTKISRNAGAGSGRWREGAEPKICVVAPWPWGAERTIQPGIEAKNGFMVAINPLRCQPSCAQVATPSDFCSSTQMTAFNRQKSTRYTARKPRNLWPIYGAHSVHGVNNQLPPFIGCWCRRVRQCEHRQRRVMLSFGGKPTIQLLTSASTLKQHSCSFA